MKVLTDWRVCRSEWCRQRLSSLLASRDAALRGYNKSDIYIILHGNIREGNQGVL